jgi:hypothetical protein
VGAGVGAGALPVAPGIRTMYMSSRLVPAFAVHTKYSPVGSMLPFGSLK